MAFEKKTPGKPDSEMMRRFKSNPGLFIGTFVVLIIVIVAFVLVPAIVPEYGGGNLDLTFGYYDKVPISYVQGNYLAQYYERVVRYRQNTMDGEYSSFVNYQNWREAFEAAVIHTAILREMQKSGYTAPEKAVDRAVARLPQFQDNGRFSPALYRQMDNNQRISLWRQVQEDIAKEHFRSDVTGVYAPSAEADFISKMASLQRSFEMTVFSVDDYPDTEYEAYIRERPELFRSIHLSMITVTSSEREAWKILASIENGETTFEDAARSFSKDNYADRGGDMGIRMVHELSFDIPEESNRETVTAFEKGEYTDVIKTSTGWSFFRVEEGPQDADVSDFAVMEKVRSYVRNFERGRMEDWAIAQADNFITLVNERGFTEALSQLGLEKRGFGPVPINYGGVDLFTTLSSQSVYELSGSVSDENFWKVAFSTPVNAPSRPVVQGNNVLVLLPIEETEVEIDVENIKSYYNDWLSYVSEQAFYQHFINSPKMEDKFFDTYRRFFMEQ
jgi:hypothetical protein